MIGLQFRFLAGRFHGNGWHQAHNEGIPEWPPSPWRVLRALVSAAYSLDLAEKELSSLLEKLRGLPRYRLPLAVDAHTRHWMPDTDDANHKKAMVFDAFVAVDGGAAEPQPLTMAWRTQLTVDERALLAKLCQRLSYLGRAESWIEVSAVDVEGDRWDAWPDESGRGAGATNLLALAPREEFDVWIRDQVGRPKGADLPRTLWDVLTFDSERYRAEGWSAVPGTRLARYVFARPPFSRSVVPGGGTLTELPTVARYAIRTAVLPSVHDAIVLGERLRLAVMSQSARVSGDARPVFSGHGDMAMNHRHAMYLSSTDSRENAGRGVIDHLIVAARGGFAEEDILALQYVRRIWGRDGHDLELILTGLGRPEDFGGARPPQTRVLSRHDVWESVTPFVPTRHPKWVRGQQVDGISDQMDRACDQLLGARPIDVKPIGDRAAWARFRRRRNGAGGRRGPDRAFGARLTFAEPVSGPIALGYGAHFGLGLFTAVEAP